MLRSNTTTIPMHAIRVRLQTILPAPLRPRLDLIQTSIPDLLSPHHIFALDGATMPHRPLGDGAALCCLDL
jgi:hypothetical protein